MYFQIAVSPKKPEKKQQLVVPLEDVAVLKLAPFTPIPKICFENVPVGEEETKKLIVQNPSACKTKLTITKLPPAERHVSLSWIEAEIEANEEKILELTWSPKEDGGWRDVLSLSDNKNINRNIPIIFKSLAKKGKKRIISKQTVKSKPTVVAAPAVKKFRSPKNTKKKRSPLKVSEPVCCMPKAYTCENCQNNIHVTTCSPIKRKSKIMESNKENSPINFEQKIENLSPIIFKQKSDNVSFSKYLFAEKLNMDNSSIFSSPTNVNFNFENIQTPIRRDTYAINRQPVINNLIKSPDNFNDSLDLEKKLSPEVSTKSATDSFVKKLNLEFTPEIPIIANINRNRSDNFLVKKLLSDSFNMSTATVAEKSHFQFVLNDSEVLDDMFYPNNCSTETKNPRIINKNKSVTPKDLFKLDNTYELSPTNKINNSIDNIAQNLSGGTYTMSNISSSSTYGILSPDNVHTRLRELTDNENYPRISTSSPVLPHSSNQLNYLNFSGINAKAALSCITEEDVSIRNLSIRSDLSCAGMKRKSDHPDMVFTVSPPKRAFIKPKSPKPKNMNTTWSKKLEKTDIIRRKSISTFRLNLSKSFVKSNISDSSISSVNITQTSCKIDPFLIAAMYDTTTANSSLDPFISSTLYYDQNWLDKQMKELKKWLNALLTPPSELATAAQSKKVDVAKLWQDCVKKDLIYAPTKEKVSSKYHTSHKLEILRKSAKNLFHSLDMRSVLSKVAITIENKHMSIREDKNLHLDVGLQSHILTLLLCYNPLWLRIGLETIYNESIPLESNSDVIGLSTFIMLRFFRCPDLMPKNKQASHLKYLPAYAAAVKKFTLKKFLMLVYFLDQAKTKKLISHDPCLFCRDAPIKESKELLLSFARELLSAVGDITKFLRRLSYEVSHKQSYIDEFDYAVINLGGDLRDGIRLTKVMEIILLRNDLTNQLRGPAISRLQKIHNVKLALDSLLQAGYTIAGDITSKDIVDGHREKTLSLLWQIIYKFQAPRFTNAVTKIQIWWKSLRIVVKRRILDRPRQLRIISAIKIQRFYRSWKLMLSLKAQFLRIKKSVITIQRFARSIFLMKRDRVKYLLKKQAAIVIQQRYRANQLMKEEKTQYLKIQNSAILIQRQFKATNTRKQYLKLIEIVTKIQRNFRSKQIVKKLRNDFLEKRSAAVVIQRHFKSIIQMITERNIYIQTRNIIIKFQQRFRATKLMKKARCTYVQQRKSVIYIQQKYRAYNQMKKIRESFLELKQAATTIQKRFRANLVMKHTRENYLRQRKAAIIIQQKFKAYFEMITCRNNYLKVKQATVYIQNKFRAKLAMKNEREFYLNQRNAAVIIQQKLRAHLEMKKCRDNYSILQRTVTYVQQIFKANIAMKETRNNYIKLKTVTILIQQRFRAKILMRQSKERYLRQRQAIIYVQQKFRAKLTMKQNNNYYLLLKKATITVQQRFRTNLLTKTQKQSYLKLKESVVLIQRIFRANISMKKCRENYLKQRELIIKLQINFRATQAMKIARENYIRERNIIIKLQQRFKANISMKNQRNCYISLKTAVTNIQRRYRANKLMKTQHQNYVQQKQAATVIQEHFRSYLEMKKCRQYYLQLKKSITIVQTRFRGKLETRSCRENYLQLRKSAVSIQRKFRAKLAMKTALENYVQYRDAVIKIQRRFRAIISMKKEREIYLGKCRSVILLQQKLRATLAMRKDRENYLKSRNAALTLQKHFKANFAMKNERYKYLQIRKTVLFLQERFKANNSMRKVRENYLRTKQSTIVIQQKFRAILAMRNARENYLKTRNAAFIIQQHFRANVAMKTEREKYLQIKTTVLFLQERFRANISMNKIRDSYLQTKQSAIIIQQRFRSILAMRKARENYLKTRNAALTLQQHFRANVVMKIEREKYLQNRKIILFLQERFRAKISMRKVRDCYLETKQSAIVIQQRFRAILAMRNARENYLKTRNAALTLQQHFRANVAMKTERERYLQIRKAVLFLQERFRATISMRKMRNSYLETKESTIIIQQKLRAYLAMKTARENYLLQRQFTILVQRRFRATLLMKQYRQKFLQQKSAAIKIQRWFKNITVSKTQEKHYLLQKKSVCIIQQRFREYSVMKKCRYEYLYTKTIINRIQTFYRNYLIMKKCRQEFLHKKEATIKIQRYFRAFLKKRLIQKYQLKIKAVVKIQSWARMYVAKKQLATLRENSKKIEERKLRTRLNKSAGKIQAAWRGYKTRKAMSKKMALIRQRSEDAASKAIPEFTIGQRNQEAIALLMFQTSMKEIIRALTILDFTTRLFPNMCVKVCDEITERLYILLVCTNRSVPDMDASVLCVSVLINLYKFLPTSASVWKPQYVERLLSLLLHWSDKDGILFPYVCTIVWLFVQKPEYSEIILAEKNAIKSLIKTYQQCTRRQKMLTRMRNATAEIFPKGHKDVFPSLVPDWGIINMNRPRVFKNPVFAIKCILKKLNIPYV